MTLTPTEETRYHRQFRLPQIGKEGQLHLKNAKILCIGAGGLGSPALLYLAAAGIGTIGIIDDDRVELSNLQRQILYSELNCGQKKVDAAKKRLTELNPSISVVTHDTRLTSTNAPTIINDYDLIIDGSDNFATRYIINDACFYAQKPFIYASIYQFEGQASTFLPGGPCYRCLFPSPPSGIAQNCVDGGVLGPLPGLLGSIQAGEAIKVLLNIGQPLVKRLLLIDLLNLSFRDLLYQQDPNCILCARKTSHTPPYPATQICDQTKIKEITVQELKQLQTTDMDFLLLDVREPFEHAIFNLKGKLIPLQELPKRHTELNKNQHTIVYCKSGGRSKRAVEFLMAQGFDSVCNLIGGMDSWNNS